MLTTGPLNVCVPANVCAASVRAIAASVDGNVIVVPSVPDKPRELLMVNVLLFAIVNVAALAGAVKATLLMDVAVATPNVGVTSVGVLDNTALPVPVEVVTPVPPRATDKVPEVPATIGRLVQFDKLPAEGVPMLGVASVTFVKSCVLVSFLVTPLCTIGISSVPAAAAAAGSWEMATVDMIYLSSSQRKC